MHPHDPTCTTFQEGHGGFNPKIGEFLGRVGRVHRITGKGDVRVEYALKESSSSVRWTLHPACLAKVKDFQPGQTVKVSADGEAVRSFQSGHGEWAPAMMQVLGQTGKVTVGKLHCNDSFADLVLFR